MKPRAQVRELLHKRIRDSYLHPQFNTDVMKPLSIEALMDQQARSHLASHPASSSQSCMQTAGESA